MDTLYIQILCCKGIPLIKMVWGMLQILPMLCSLISKFIKQFHSTNCFPVERDTVRVLQHITLLYKKPLMTLWTTLSSASHDTVLALCTTVTTVHVASCDTVNQLSHCATLLVLLWIILALYYTVTKHQKKNRFRGQHILLQTLVTLWTTTVLNCTYSLRTVTVTCIIVSVCSL